MYCPKCRAEFREGFTRCIDCDADLVTDMPPEAEYVDMVTVFEGNSNSAPVTSAMLTSAGIESWIKDEGIQGVFPNLATTEVQVRMRDEESARKEIGATVQNMDSP